MGLRGQLVAVNPTGSVLWRLRLPDGVRTLAEGASGVILAAGRHYLHAVNPGGNAGWRAPIGPPGRHPGDRRPSLATDAAGTVYVGTAAGKVRIFSAAGKLLSILSVGPASYQAPQVFVADGRLIVNGTDGELRVYGEATHA